MAKSAVGLATGEATGRSVVVLAAGWESAVRGRRMISTGLSSEATLLISTGSESLVAGAVGWRRLVERRVGVRVVDGRVRWWSAVLGDGAERWWRRWSLMSIMVLLDRISRLSCALNWIWRVGCALNGVCRFSLNRI